MQEIVGASAWYKITIFDADRKTPVWEIATDLDIGALLVADADGDGVPEILYGDGQWGKIHAINAVTRADMWSVNNPEHGVSGIALADADLDGKTQGFIIPKDTEGLTISDEREKLMSLNALPFYRVTLDSVKVPAENRLGGETGHDFEPVLAALRVATAAKAVGVANAA
mgnify:CR=1 FL=1